MKTIKLNPGEHTITPQRSSNANRYLKFKFLTHYGDEFYCTVTQVKVHGSTMMESFQHEWQQSSAEVREVQDSLMMNKKENAKIATAAAGTHGNGTRATATGPPLGADSSGSDGNAAPTGVAPTRHSNTATHSATPTSTTGVSSAGGEGGVGHRPHAASAATVPPLAEKRAVAGGDAGPAELTVEDIVRGVPAEMVVPATPCSGRTGADGTCREGILAEMAGNGRAEEGAAESNPLAAEVPTMGATGARPYDAGANDENRVVAPAKSATGTGGVGVGGVGESVGGSGVDEKRASEGGADVNVAGVGKASGGTVGLPGGDAGEKAELGVGGSSEETPGVVSGDEQGEEAVAGPVDSSVGGGDMGEASAQPAQGEEGEEPLPRKGIITSTMEAISKAVGGSDGGKKRKSDDDKPPVDDANTAAAAALSASPGTVPTAGVSGSDSPTVGDGVQGEKGLGMDDPRGGGEAIGALLEIDSQGDAADVISQNAAQVDAVDAPGDAGTHPVGAVSSAGGADGASSRESAAAASGGGVPGVMLPAGQELEADSGSGNGNVIPDTGPDHSPSNHDVASEPYEHPNKDNDVSGGAVGAGGSGEAPPRPTVAAELSGTGEVVTAEVGANPGVMGVADVASNSDAQAAAVDGLDVSAGVGRKGDGAEVPEGTEYVAGSDAAAASDADAAHSASAERNGNQEGLQVPPVSVGVQTENGQQHLPPDAEEQQRFAGAGADVGAGVGGSASAPGQDGEGGSPEKLVQLTDAARAAACLDRLSFSEFRDEVLARMQQGQQSAGGGVTIGGQYESIFKTLMNKIKTLEINQSLFSLYVGERHTREKAHPSDVLSAVWVVAERSKSV